MLPPWWKKDGRLVFQSRTEESLGLITSEKTTISTSVFDKKKCNKVVKSLERTDNEVRIRIRNELLSE
jgi:hypothetical protein